MDVFPYFGPIESLDFSKEALVLLLLVKKFEAQNYIC